MMIFQKSGLWSLVAILLFMGACGNSERIDDEDSDDGIALHDGRRAGEDETSQKVKLSGRKLDIDILGDMSDLTSDTNVPKYEYTADLPDLKIPPPKIKQAKESMIVADKDVVASLDTQRFQKYTARKIEVIYSESPTSLAGILSSQVKKAFAWRPSKRSDGTNFGLPWLICSAISNDGSLFALVERIGEASGPNGSRIILISAYDFTIKNIIETQRIVSSVVIDDSRKSIYCKCDEQQVFKQEECIVEFKLKDGAEKQYLAFPPNAKFKHFALSAKHQKMLLTFEGEPTIHFYNLAKLNILDGEKLTLKTSDFFAAFSNADRSVSVFTPSMITDYDVRDYSPVQSRTLPELSTVPKSALNLGSRNLWAVSTDETYFINGTNCVQLDKNASDFMFAQQDIFYISSEITQNISVFAKLPFKQQDMLEFRRIEPRSRVAPILVSYTACGNRIIYMDKAGFLYILVQAAPKKPWTKIQIFEPEK